MLLFPAFVPIQLDIPIAALSRLQGELCEGKDRESVCIGMCVFR